MTPEWPDWRGEVCAIVAGGESVRAEDVSLLKGRCRVIVVNNSYQIAPWADVLYAADQRWWTHHRHAHDFEGLKLTCHLTKALPKGVRTVPLCEQGDPKENDLSQTWPLSRGGHSGFQAINLAILFGAKRHLWLGFDFCGDHWHGKHPQNLTQTRPSTREKWRAGLDGQADSLKRMGVEIRNCSSVSLMRNYQKTTVAEALGEFCGEHDRQDLGIDAGAAFNADARHAPADHTSEPSVLASCASV